MSNIDENIKFSIIVPVYKAEEFLAECIESIINQEENQEGELNNLKGVQLILVNDGSPDNSAEICKEYKEKYPNNIEFIDKENGGVSSARNAGIRASVGKYILMLDSDDMLEETTLKSTFEYFENIYGLVDIITYPIYNYIDGEIKTHARSATYKNDRIINTKINYFVQPTSNICFKNMGDENIMYDEDLHYCEDSFFAMNIILKKNRIGICSSGMYLYRRDLSHESAITKYETAYDAFDMVFNNLFKKYIKSFAKDGVLPLYVQNVIMNEMNWRLKANKLIPHHLDEKIWKETICNILKYIDDETILKHEAIDRVHKVYFLGLKDSKFSMYSVGNSLAFYSGNFEEIQTKAYSEIVLTRLNVVKDRLLLSGFLKEPYALLSDFKIVVCVNDEEYTVELYDSNHSFYKSNEKTGSFKAFDFEIELGKLEKETTIEMFVELGNKRFSTSFYLFKSKKLSANAGIKVNKFVDGNYLIKLIGSKILINKVSILGKCKSSLEIEKAFYKVNKKATAYRMIGNKNIGKVWIYNDRDTILDNAYYQFKHDITKKDGIKRYFVIKGKLENINKYFTKHEQKHIVQFGSLKHRFLFLNCTKLLYSFNNVAFYSPFTAKATNYYKDIMKCEQIYLQHGILHANTPRIYGNEYTAEDKIVISSDFEYRNFINTYKYKPEQLIKSGMARFDIVNNSSCSDKDNKKIIFVPSWRSSLIGKTTEEVIPLKEQKFLDSSYYKKINEILNNKQFSKILEDNNIQFDFGIHPIFECYSEHFTTISKNIKISTKTDDILSYDLCITDFSSFVFDFVYLNKPIMYFVPDMAEWKGGNHLYNKLDLPIEEGFGKLTENINEFICTIQEFIDNDFKTTGIYKERIENFFIEKGNHREKLYEALIKS